MFMKWQNIKYLECTYVCGKNYIGTGRLNINVKTVSINIYTFTIGNMIIVNF